MFRLNQLTRLSLGSKRPVCMSLAPWRPVEPCGFAGHNAYIKVTLYLILYTLSLSLSLSIYIYIYSTFCVILFSLYPLLKSNPKNTQLIIK